MASAGTWTHECNVGSAFPASEASSAFNFTKSASPGALTFYSDRTTYETDFPGLELEDFEDGLTLPTEVLVCSDPFNSTTNDVCWTPGDVIADVDFGSSSGLDMVTVGGDVFGTGDGVIVGPNFFADSLVVDFTGTTFATGMEVVFPLAAHTVAFNVNVYDTGGGFLGGTTLTADPNVYVFFGVASATQIGSIEIDSPEADLIDNFSMSSTPFAFAPERVVSSWGTEAEFEAELLRQNPSNFTQVRFNRSEWENATAFIDAGVNVSSVSTGATALTGEAPSNYVLEGSYPNPFNPSTTIGFSLPESAQVRLVVYDVLGRQVRVLLDGIREAGTHEVVFDASDLPSGTYLYRLETPQGSFVRTMLLTK